jgi:hypothetical protein
MFYPKSLFKLAAIAVKKERVLPTNKLSNILIKAVADIKSCCIDDDIYEAAKQGHLDCLRYLHENGYETNRDVCAASLTAGHLGCLKYLLDVGYRKPTDKGFDDIRRAIDFLNIKVSTQTYTVKSNIRHIDLAMFFYMMEITDQILTVKYQNEKKGDLGLAAKPKKKRADNKAKRNFLNCVTIVIFAEKRVNVKVFKNGVFQITGCKHLRNVKSCISILVEEIKRILGFDEACLSFAADSENDFIFYVKSAMRNIDFDLGFKVDRTRLSEKLISMFIEDDDVIIPDAVGNKMDVKMKLRVSRTDLELVPVVKIVYGSENFPIEEIVMDYKSCVRIMESDSEKKIETKLKNKFVSASIFQNGKVLLSAVDETVQKKYYEWFVDLMKELESDVKQCAILKKTFLRR